MWEFGDDNDDLFSWEPKKVLRWFGRRFLEYGTVSLAAIIVFFIIAAFLRLSGM